MRKVSLDVTNLGGEKNDVADIFRQLGRDVAQFADKIEDGIERLFGRDEGPERQRVEAHVSLAAKVVSTFDFVVETSGATPGDAHIYHFTEENSKGQLDGGLTVVVVIR